MVDPAVFRQGIASALLARLAEEEPDARLRIIGAAAQGAEATAYLAHCRALAAQLFPDEATDAHAVGDNCVSFEEVGGPGAPELVDAYAAGGVVVLSSIVEGFPVAELKDRMPTLHEVLGV